MFKIKNINILNYLALIVSTIAFVIYLMMNVSSDAVLDPNIVNLFTSDLISEEIQYYITTLSNMITLISDYYYILLSILMISIIVGSGLVFLISSLLFRRVYNTSNNNFIALVIIILLALLQIIFIFNLMSNFIVSSTLNNYSILLDMNLSFIIFIAIINIIVSSFEFYNQIKEVELKPLALTNNLLKIIFVFTIVVLSISLMMSISTYVMLVNILAAFSLGDFISITQIIGINTTASFDSFLSTDIINMLSSMDFDATMSLSDYGITNSLIDTLFNNNILIYLDQAIKNLVLSISSNFIFANTFKEVVALIITITSLIFINLKNINLALENNLIIKAVISLSLIMVYFFVIKAFYSALIIVLLFIILTILLIELVKTIRSR